MDQFVSNTLLYAQFEEQVRRTPDRVALYEGEQSITYAELGAQAGHVAKALHSRGIKQGCVVGLHTERSINWAAAMLGILRSNAAVLPMPSSFPATRLKEILSFAQLDAVVDDAAAPLDSTLANQIWRLEDLMSEENLPNDIEPGRPDQAAFVLSSSGSTGIPKLIVRSHLSFFHRLNWTWDTLPFRADEICCQKSHMTTTHCIYELFEPLLRGIPTMILPDSTVRNLELFWETVRKRGVSRLLIVPSMLRATLDIPSFELPALNVIVLMGEYVDPSLAERTLAAFPTHTRPYSIYGCSEASSTLVCDIRKSYRQGEDLFLGTPISDDVHVEVLGPRLEPVTPGEVGRLYIGGSALFESYWHDPEATKSAFVHSPQCDDQLYDTKDEVRLLRSGDLQYVGRVDHTVKIRGFRVNTQEVENVLRLHPEVTGAVVVAENSNSGASKLVGFVTPAAVDRSSVLRHVSERLPDYMLPSTLVKVDTLPMTSSGKVDRVRLLENHAANIQEIDSDHEWSDTERAVKTVWEGVLEHGNFGPEDSFFEVGGTSLNAFALVHKLWEAFDLNSEQLSIQLVYSHPTFVELARRIDAVRGNQSEHTTAATPILVTLRKGSDSTLPPFFVIASAGGTLGAYAKLAKALDISRPVIGVRDPYLWGDRDPTQGFQHWVADYVDAIQSHQPEGPYYIGAYSSAGSFGYEIVRQLRLRGHTVALLVLIDPLVLDYKKKWHYGYWVHQSISRHPLITQLVRLAGRLRDPILRFVGKFRRPEVENNLTWTGGQIEQIIAEAKQDKMYIMSLSGLLELNSDLPFALFEDEFEGLAPDQFYSVLQTKAEQLTPGFDADSFERLFIQYQLQARCQHTYRLQPLEAKVLLVEPVSPHAGIVAAQFRPYIRNLESIRLNMGQNSNRTRRLSKQLGKLAIHYRSMRDDTFVAELASDLNSRLA